MRSNARPSHPEAATLALEVMEEIAEERRRERSFDEERVAERHRRDRRAKLALFVLLPILLALTVANVATRGRIFVPEDDAPVSRVELLEELNFVVREIDAHLEAKGELPTALAALGLFDAGLAYRRIGNEHYRLSLRRSGLSLTYDSYTSANAFFAEARAPRRERTP